MQRNLYLAALLSFVSWKHTGVIEMERGMLSELRTLDGAT